MTAQRREQLILEGDLVSMAYCPYLPTSHPRIVPAVADSDFALSTDCWRRYVGTWEIRRRRFYLLRLEGCLELVGDERLFADWFTGVLRIPVGECLMYVHMGFGSVHRYECHIRVEAGRAVERRWLENHGPYDRTLLEMSNLPGLENSFPGDDYWD